MSEPIVDVAAWLGRLGLGQYARAFAENDIDSEALCSLTADDLRELGVRSLGHRKKLLHGGADNGTLTRQLHTTTPRGANTSLARRARG
jgi:hypothetical protein